MIRPIVLYGDPILKEKSGEIPKSFPKLYELANDMFETMHKAGGVGLSAIQIGIPLRIFVIEAHIGEENFHFRGIFINPYLRNEWGQKCKFTEGCLSIPSISAMVERSSNIELEYYDENWNFHVEKFNGYKARIIQHEYDHLEGILYIERLDRLWEEALNEPLNLIKERKITIKYLTK